MEMSQGNSLYSYLIQKKCLFSKMETRKGGWCQWEGEDIRKGEVGEYGGSSMYSGMKMEQ
jgi:hypothetical protein